jgi:hypothetical protein
MARFKDMSIKLRCRADSTLWIICSKCNRRIYGLKQIKESEYFENLTPICMSCRGKLNV